MAALVLKNLPDALFDRLKFQARANRRSLTKEAVVVLSNGVAQRPDNAGRPGVTPAPPVALLGGQTRREEDESASLSGPQDTRLGRERRDGREALRAALVEQPDGSYVNVLGIVDETFFTTLESVRREISLPDVPDCSSGPA